MDPKFKPSKQQLIAEEQKKLFKNRKVVQLNKFIKGDVSAFSVNDLKIFKLIISKVDSKDSLFKDFLRGYFDGDGWICVYENKTKYHSKKTNKTIINKYKICEVGFTGTNYMCIFLHDIFKKLGIESHLKKDKRCDDRINNIKITNKEGIKKFYDFIYSNAHIFLTRKKEKFVIK